MDLKSMILGGAGEEQAVEQRLSKEEYAAMKKQQREEVWAEVDAQAQAVFSSPTVSKSTVMHRGVPISSSRR